MTPKPKLLIEEQILLHLSNSPKVKTAYGVPRAVCQDGMADALSIHQPQVAKATRKLLEKGLIHSSIAHVEGISKARKIYQLTDKGEVKVNAIKNALAGQEAVDYRPKDLLFSLSNAIYNLQEMETKTSDAKTQLEIVSKLQELYYELGQRLNIDESYRVLELSKNIGKEVDVAKAYYFLGKTYSLQNKWDMAIDNYKHGLAVVKNKKMHGMISEINLALASVYSRIGELKEQETHLQAAIEAAEKTNDLELTIRAFIDLGLLYICLGNYSKAKWEFEKATDLVDKADYKGYHLMRLYNNWGRLAISKKKYREAITHFNKVIEYANDRNYTIGLAYGLTNSAEAYAKLGDLKSATEAMKRAVSIVNYLKNENLRMGLLRTSGIIAIKQGNMKRAEEVFKESIEIARKLNHRYFLAKVLLDYASIYKTKVQMDKKKELLNEALEIAKELGNKKKMKMIEGELAKL